MSDEPPKKYPDLTDFYRRKEELRKLQARRPAAEKMAIVERLRDLERSLSDVRKENKAKRAAKQVRIEIKTR